MCGADTINDEFEVGFCRPRLTKQDVMAAARQRGPMRLEQVRYAAAERDGKISIAQDPDA